MSRDELLALLHDLLRKLNEEGDIEQVHVEADAALLEYIGDDDVRAAFHAMKKWYA